MTKRFDVKFHSVYTDENGFLKSFIDSTKSLSPDEKGQKLEDDEVNSNFALLFEKELSTLKYINNNSLPFVFMLLYVHLHQ